MSDAQKKPACIRTYRTRTYLTPLASVRSLRWGPSQRPEGTSYPLYQKE